MHEAEGVPHLVHGLLGEPLDEQPPPEQLDVLGEPGRRHDGGDPAELRLSEHVGEDRDAAAAEGNAMNGPDLRLVDR